MAFENDDAGGRLLAPAKPKRHQVRVQGRLVLVRSVSAVNLNSPSTSSSSPGARPPPLPSPLRLRGDPGVGYVADNRRSSSNSQQKTSTRRRRDPRPQSYAGTDTGSASSSTVDGLYLGVDDDDNDDDEHEEEDHHQTALRDRQRRGYGIGGAGNIRRPTEVIQFYSLSSPLSASRRSRSQSRHIQADRSGESEPRRRWQWMNSLLVNIRGKRGEVDREDGRVAATGKVAHDFDRKGS